MGIKWDIYNLNKEKVSEIELSEAIFDVSIKKHLLHLVVVSQLNAKRAGTASAKRRSEVSCSGRKLWRQKGTGRARVGDAGSPIRVGGGVAFPPKPRDYHKKVNRKVRKAALRMALTDKIKNQMLILIDNMELPGIKTKRFIEIMQRFGLNNGKKVLLVTSDRHTNLEKSSHNVPWAKIIRWEGLNVYDLLYHDHVLMEEPAVKNIEEALR